MSETKAIPYKDSPLKLAPLAIAAIGGGAMLMGAWMRGRTMDDKPKVSAHDAKMDEQLEALQTIGRGPDGKFTNMFANATNAAAGIKYGLEERDFKNQFAGFKNTYKDLGETGITNPYEDMTVNQKAAEFQRQQFQQSQANIMQGLRGAAGGSGVAGLAQAMAGQGAIQAQHASADIGAQEQAIQLRSAGAGMDIQRLEAQRQELIARGDMDAQMARMQGAQSAEQMEVQRETQIAQGQFQAAQVRAQGEMAVQEMQMQGAQSARELDLQAAQGLLAYHAGQKESEQQYELANKSWLERIVG